MQLPALFFHRLVPSCPSCLACDLFIYWGWAGKCNSICPPQLSGEYVLLYFLSLKVLPHIIFDVPTLLSSCPSKQFSLISSSSLAEMCRIECNLDFPASLFHFEDFQLSTSYLISISKQLAALKLKFWFFEDRYGREYHECWEWM